MCHDVTCLYHQWWLPFLTMPLLRKHWKAGFLLYTIKENGYSFSNVMCGIKLCIIMLKLLKSIFLLVQMITCMWSLHYWECFSIYQLIVLLLWPRTSLCWFILTNVIISRCTRQLFSPKNTDKPSKSTYPAPNSMCTNLASSWCR